MVNTKKEVLKIVVRYQCVFRRKVVRVLEVGLHILGLVSTQVRQEAPDIEAIDRQRRIAHPATSKLSTNVPIKLVFAS